MDNFFVFYALKGVEILVVVLVVSGIVALVEKAFGADTTPRHVRKQRAMEAADAGRDLTPLRSNILPLR
ncbi:MAG: hypothetical protein JWM36_692 [Hyphomicrobiales bacterium]|nr:hypothetical protein [Hyphomicrobiales bacterium]